MTVLFLALANVWILNSATAATAATQNITLKNGKGDVVGSALLTPVAKGVKIDVTVHDMPPGEHAIHFHEKGACQGPKFDSAGGHFSPTKMQHGFDSEGGPHAGDMPNFFVGKDGTAKVELVNTRVVMGAGENSLNKTGGTALVIHERADDYKTQTSGNAGGRFACGEIKGM